MKASVDRIYEVFKKEWAVLEPCFGDILKAYTYMEECYKSQHKVLTCGNGGSASDSEHIVGELMKGFISARELPEDIKNTFIAVDQERGEYIYKNLQGALPAISLVNQSALITAYLNDVEGDMIFAQQVWGYGEKGDVLIALSTSGNSKNVINAIVVAKALEMKVIGLTGENGGQMKAMCDVTLKVPTSKTYQVQQYHLPIYHLLCAMIEEEIFGEGEKCVSRD